MKTCLHRAPGAPSRRRPIVAGLLAAVLVISAAACEPPPENPPSWSSSGSVTATVVGPFVRLRWTAPTGGDPEAWYQINLTSGYGPVVALIPASIRDCYISGLAANTTYTLVVTARDADLHWSGNLAGPYGKRTTTVTTASNGGAGSGMWCDPPTDSDGDLLPNAFETNDGTYDHAADAGTSPSNPDTDNDGIKDGDEVLGRPGINLIGMGARPTHKDMLVETDWLDSAPCSTRPTATRLAPVIQAYANAPVSNPDGTTGIKLMVDYGQGGHFTGGNLVADTFGAVDGNYQSSSDPYITPPDVANANMSTHRKGIFRYSITHHSGSNFSFGGWITVVSHPCTDPQVDLRYPDLFMHEIGHNLTLDHGGDTTNAGFNYNSIMSHWISYEGVDEDCDGFGDGRIDYSHGNNANLNEAALNESQGVCNGVDRDFNRNTVIDPGTISFDHNNDGQIGILKDFDDWAHIEATGLAYYLKLLFW